MDEELVAHLESCTACRDRLFEIRRMAAHTAPRLSSCEDALVILSEPDPNRVSAETWAALFTHLADCPDCRMAGAPEASLHPGHDGQVDPPPAIDVSSPLPFVSRQNYRFIRKVAEGGMGRIWACIDQRIGRTVLVKEARVTPDMPWQERQALYARLEAEARLTTRLEHPAIVSVYEAGRWSTGEPFYAMRAVRGVALDQDLRSKESLHEHLERLPSVIAVAEAMAYAHEQGIVHRDLKPANVLVGDFGNTVVIDWGLAKDLRRQTPDPTLAVTLDPNGTELGTALGTPGYMAPEQARAEPVDPRTDVYAIGALLYHLSCGHAPYRDQGSVTRMLRPPDVTAPTPIRRLVPDVPPALASIVERAMAADPDDRYANARELAEDLRRFQQGAIVSSHRYSVNERIGRWFERHAAATLVGGLALIGLAGILAWSVMSIRAREAETRTQAAAAAQHRDDVISMTQQAMKEAEDAKSARLRAERAEAAAERRAQEAEDALRRLARQRRAVSQKDRQLQIKTNQLEAAQRSERAARSETDTLVKEQSDRRSNIERRLGPTSDTLTLKPEAP